ncbi:MAG: PKD domain-containing protein [Nitrososphaerota archaeon]
MNTKIFIGFIFLSMILSLNSMVLSKASSSNVKIEVITIEVPEYEIMKINGFDFVDIPKGHVLLVEGKPRVPYYIALIEYPKGYRVQNVFMKERSGLMTVAGLNLTIVSLIPESSSTQGSEESLDWYPTLDYRWRTWVNLDGSSTLEIEVFPFYYNPETKEAKFYKHYEFEVVSIFSTVSILNIVAEKSVYDPGEKVNINILLNNTDEAKNIIVNSLIKRGKEIIDSLPLTMLHNVIGEASFSIDWDSTGFPVGDYCIEIMLNDTSGNWLDKKIFEFKLGRPMINITKFNVEPQHFKIGDQVEISLEALNTGSTTLDGKCIFMIQNGNGTIWYSYQNFSSLSPKSSLKFTSVWDTSSAKKGALYYVIGYVSYESQTTPPMTIMISTNYLPIAKFSYTPIKVGLGEEVIFDASASSDPDGSISSYKWEFGDGGKGSGVKVKHSYHGLGDYLVKLTVTDNEGASNSTIKLIKVVMAYNLNVSSNVAIEIPGSGKYKEGDEVTLSAPSSASIPGLLGLLGAKYVFKQWTGFLNSTDSSVKLVLTGYEPWLEMQAIYSEDYTTTIIIVAIVSVAIILTIVLSLYIRRSKKRSPAPS